MKSFFANSYLLLVFLFIFSCGEKEKPEKGTGRVSFNGIELVNPSTVPSGKLSASKTWEHKFQEQIELIIESESGQTYNLNIQPNDFRVPNSIDLPIGSYSLRSTKPSASISEVLPIYINQEITVGAGLQSLKLKASSEYGLFTLTKQNLGNTAPELIQVERPLSSREEFYFIYALKDQNLTVKINLSNNTSFFRSIWNVEEYNHRHLDLYLNQTPGQSVSFLPTDFTLKQDFIPLSPTGMPLALSPTLLADLPVSQDENSGLAYIQNRLFSINDGGNSNEIFELNPLTGTVIRTIRVSNAVNIDWEDLAQSESHLYIGDFGNNAGTRKDLAILKIEIAQLLNNTEVEAERISFSYSDQVDFSGNSVNHNYDCEAFFFWNNSLHLFTKNRGDLKTNHYTVDPNENQTVALKNSSFDVQGLITGASISATGNVVLLGYEASLLTPRSFVFLFSEFGGNNFFSGKSKNLRIGNPTVLSQTEGIIFEREGIVLISGERINFSGQTVPARISKLDLTGLF